MTQLDLSDTGIAPGMSRAPFGIRWRHALGVPLLVFAGGIAVLMPARHGLLPLWPTGLAEVVYRAEDDATRIGLFEVVRAGADGELVLRGDDVDGRGAGRLELAADAVLARSHPLTATVVVDRDGRRRFAYLSGVRAGAGAGAAPGDDALLRADHHGYRGEADHRLLLLRYPDGRSESLPLADLVRHYRPNRLGFPDKLRLFLSRFAERWRQQTHRI